MEGAFIVRECVSCIPVTFYFPNVVFGLPVLDLYCCIGPDDADMVHTLFNGVSSNKTPTDPESGPPMVTRRIYNPVACKGESDAHIDTDASQ